MPEAPIYKKSPITEAVIDFRVELLDDVLLPTLATANAGQEAEYPVGQELLSLGGEIQYTRVLRSSVASPGQAALRLSGKILLIRV